MESRVNNDRPRKRVKVTTKQKQTVRLVLVRDMKLNIWGPVTRKLYTFNGAGHQQDVDKEDAEIMLKRRGYRSCCGGQASHYFNIVSEV